MARPSVWHRTHGGLDEVYLDGQLVLFPLAADDVAGWVQLCRPDRAGNPTEEVAVLTGHVDIVRCLDCDPFADASLAAEPDDW